MSCICNCKFQFYHNHFLFGILLRWLPFPYLSIHGRLRRLRETSAIIHKSRFITHNSRFLALAPFPGVISKRTDAGLKSQSDVERNLSIEFHGPSERYSSHKNTYTYTHVLIAPFLSILQRHQRPINIRARFSNRIGRKKWKVISLRNDRSSRLRHGAAVKSLSRLALVSGNDRA